MSRNAYTTSSFSDLLRGCPGVLSKMHQRIIQITACQEKLRSELGLPLSEHLNVANISSDTLTLYTDNPAWASRLRFNIRKILNIAKQECGLNELKSVRIKVIIRNNSNKPLIRSLTVSENIANMIGKTSESINDQRLRTSLQNLSKHRV